MMADTIPMWAAMAVVAVLAVVLVIVSGGSLAAESVGRG